MPGRGVARIPLARLSVPLFTSSMCVFSRPRPPSSHPRLRIAVIYGVIFFDMSCIVEIEEKNVAMCSETG